MVGEGGRGGRVETNFAGFVLCDFVLGVFLAALALAVSAAGLRNVDLMTHDNVSCGFIRCREPPVFVTSNRRRSEVDSQSSSRL